VAAIINSVWRVSMTSWSCLLVEDTDPRLLVDIYSWLYMSGYVAAFLAPLAGLLIATYSLIPTMRALYLLAFVMMTIKFIATNAMVTETSQGKIRMEQTRHQNLFSLLGEYKGVFRQILHARQTLLTLGVMLVMSTCAIVSGAFWSIYVTEQLDIPPEHLALYPFARSITMLFFFFLVMPKIRQMNFRNPMLIGLVGYVISQLILITSPAKSYLILLASTVIEAMSYATVSTLLDKMVVVTVDAKERARILAILYVIMILFTTPFGWIAGNLSEINRVLPFVMNIVFFCIGGVLIFIAARVHSQLEKAEQELAA